MNWQRSFIAVIAKYSFSFKPECRVLNMASIAWRNAKNGFKKMGGGRMAVIQN